MQLLIGINNQEFGQYKPFEFRFMELEPNFISEQDFDLGNGLKDWRGVKERAQKWKGKIFRLVSGRDATDEEISGVVRVKASEYFAKKCGMDEAYILVDVARNDW